MVAAAAAADAIERARRLPSLRVGLHLVLVRGSSLLPPADIPDLVDETGSFSPQLVRAGVNFFRRPAVRRQLEAEIRAQFAAFSSSRLQLDHVNAHNHMHLHPTILGLILKVGRDYGLGAVRLPREPFLPSWRAARAGFLRRLGSSLFLSPWVAVMERRLRHAKVLCNDYLFGMHDSGRMSRDLLVRLLANLPRGVSEIHFHPAVRKWSGMDHYVQHYECAEELEALTGPAVASTLRNSEIQRISFSDLQGFSPEGSSGRRSRRQ
jgi:hopanoid biosynthesis associated protein HpnK